MPGQAAQHRPHEQLEGDEAAHRVAGQAEEPRRAPVRPLRQREGQRLARLDRHAPEVHPTDRREGVLDQVVRADRHAARRHHHVRRRDPLPEQPDHLVRGVGRNPQADDVRAGIGRLCRDRDRVAVRDLGGAERLAGRHQLVARGKDRDARPPMDADRAVSSGRDHGQGLRRQGRARFDEAVAGPEVAAGRPDVGTGRCGTTNGHPFRERGHALGSVRLLDRHDRIGARGACRRSGCASRSRPRRPTGTWPAATSPTTRSRTGSCSEALATSADRTAKPSMAELSHGGSVSFATPAPPGPGRARPPAPRARPAAARRPSSIRSRASSRRRSGAESSGWRCPLTGWRTAPGAGRVSGAPAAAPPA